MCTVKLNRNSPVRCRRLLARDQALTPMLIVDAIPQPDHGHQTDPGSVEAWQTGAQFPQIIAPRFSLLSDRFRSNSHRSVQQVPQTRRVDVLTS